MEDSKENAFFVNYKDKSGMTETTFIVNENHIECQSGGESVDNLNPKSVMNLTDLLEIRINISQKKKWRKSTFGLKFKENAVDFVAKDREQRNEILKQILSRFPSGGKNLAHLKVIESSKVPEILVLDHGEREKVESGDMMSTSDVVMMSTLVDNENDNENQENLSSKESTKMSTKTNGVNQQNVIENMVSHQNSNDESAKTKNENASKSRNPSKSAKSVKSVKSGRASISRNNSKPTKSANSEMWWKSRKLSKSLKSTKVMASAMASFKVRYVDGRDMLQTVISIFEEHIECPKTPDIPFSALKEMQLNISGREKYRERSFGFVVNGISGKQTFEFWARNKGERNQILKEILDRIPENETNRAHYEMMESVTNQQSLVLDHVPCSKPRKWSEASHSTKSVNFQNTVISSANHKMPTFTVRFVEGLTVTQTVIAIFENHIECPLTPNIPFEALSDILINVSEREKHRERSFGVVFNGKTLHFVAKHKKERNQILRQILDRFPGNNTNRAHWKTVQSASTAQRLVLDHDSADESVTAVTEKWSDRKLRESVRSFEVYSDAASGDMMIAEVDDIDDWPQESMSKNSSNIQENEKSSNWQRGSVKGYYDTEGQRVRMRKLQKKWESMAPSGNLNILELKDRDWELERRGMVSEIRRLNELLEGCSRQQDSHNMKSSVVSGNDMFLSEAGNRWQPKHVGHEPATGDVTSSLKSQNISKYVAFGKRQLSEQDMTNVIPRETSKFVPHWNCSDKHGIQEASQATTNFLWKQKRFFPLDDDRAHGSKQVTAKRQEKAKRPSCVTMLNRYLQACKDLKEAENQFRMECHNEKSVEWKVCRQLWDDKVTSLNRNTQRHKSQNSNHGDCHPDPPQSICCHIPPEFAHFILRHPTQREHKQVEEQKESTKKV